MKRAALLLLIVFASAALTACHEPADKGGWMFHLNLWGYKGGGGTNYDIGPALISSVDGRNPKPSNISLNEVCSAASGNYIGSRLSSRGYSSAHYYAHAVGGSCGSFGNFVASRFPYAGYDRKSFTGAGEARTVICVKVTGFVAGQICSSHLGTTEAQKNSQIVQLTQYIQARSILAVGADLNMGPGDSRLLFLYGAGLIEGTGGPPPSNATTFKSKSTGAERRLDYIFLNDFFFDPHLPGRFRGPLTHTDHYIYEAFIE